MGQGKDCDVAWDIFPPATSDINQSINKHKIWNQISRSGLLKPPKCLTVALKEGLDLKH